MEARERLIFALDVRAMVEARGLAAELAPHVGMFKVGLELFVQAGAEGVRGIQAAGRPVFLDLKLHDIPETVERAVERAAGLGVSLLTVHAGGGPKMLERAVRATEGTELQIVAVTVLTSLDDVDLGAVGVVGSTLEHAARLARLAHGQGVRAFVCSPREAAALREALGPKVQLICPGVRPGGGGGDDQKRTATPASARAAGADRVVVGRPIRDAEDRVAMAARIVKELA